MSTKVLPDDTEGRTDAPEAERVQHMLQCAVSTLQGMIDGEYELGVVYGTLAGLETAVVVLQAHGGFVPVFAHINENLAPVLRNALGELPQPLDGERQLLAS